MAFAFTFPGQGSQYIGMGKALAENFSAAQSVFEEVNSALSQNLSALMWEGPVEKLTLTANAQPALMATSMAVIRVLEEEFGIYVTRASYVAGHSLGEYSALCAAGSIPLIRTAELLRIRGNAMQASVPVGVGAMAALLGASLEDAEAAVEAGSKVGVCQIANDNAPGQIVISGETAAVERASDAAKSLGVKRAVMLPVSAPFHCDLMAPAADVMADELAQTRIASPVVPLVNNVRAMPVEDADLIRDDLVAQVTGRVRWSESVSWMAGAGDIDTFVEPGSGNVLTGLLRRIDKNTKGIALNNPEDIEAFAQDINA